MWNYEKRLQYPVNIKQTNPKIAQVIMSQYGGPDGELGASMRFISQFGGPDGWTGVCNWLENAIIVEVLFSQCYIRDI